MASPPLCFRLIILTIALILQTPLRVSSSIPVPSIVEAQHHWITINSRQVSHLAVDLRESSQSSIWLVEDSFSLADDLSYSLHTSEATNESYALLTHDGRTYYATEDAKKNVDCRLDHRQDYLTLEPWRYSTVITEGKKQIPGPTVIGVGGLWLNAIKEKVQCEQKSFLHCSMACPSKKYFVELEFANELIKSAHVKRWQTFKHDHSSKLVDIEVEATVSSIQSSLPQLQKNKVLQLLRQCQNSVSESDTVFPSLMRQLAESANRNYLLSYEISLFKSKSNVKSQEIEFVRKYDIQEWFSYEWQAQTLQRFESSLDHKNEKFHSRFKCIHPTTGMVASFRVFKEQEIDECLVEDFEDPLSFVSDLMYRKMHFVSNSMENSVEKRRHSGTLVGLGALLMNAGDIQGKRLVTETTMRRNNPEFKVDKKHLWGSEWVIEDSLQGKEIRLAFMHNTSNHKHQLGISDLSSIQIHHLTGLRSSPDQKLNSSSIGGVESIDEILYKRELMMTIRLREFRTNLHEDELAQSFHLPLRCDFNEDECTENVDTDSWEKKNHTYENDDKPPLEFPAFELYLDMARGYIINSEWTFGNGTNVHFKEYSMFDSRAHQLRLLNRVDIARQDNINKKRPEECRFFIEHSAGTDTGTIFRYRAPDECRQVDGADDWLEQLSYNLGRQYGIENKDLRYYGVAGFWHWASLSPFVEFLGEFPEGEDKTQKYALWRLEDPIDVVNLSLVFKFSLLDMVHYDMQQRVRLDSIEVDASKLSGFDSDSGIIHVKQIQVEPDAANGLHFVLPSACNMIKHNSQDPQGPQFPSFIEVFEQPPSMATFEMLYQLDVTTIEDSYTLRMVEAKNSKDLGQISMAYEGQNWVFWLTTGRRVLLEQSSSGRCKLMQEPISGFFEIETHLHNIIGNNTDLRLKESNYLVANLWHLMSMRVKTSPDSVMTRRESVDDPSGQTIQLIHWFFEDYTSLVEFAFKQASDKLELHEITLSSKWFGGQEAQQGPTMRFEFQNITREPSDLSDDTELIPECYISLDANKFPHLSQLLAPQESMHVRSELVTDSGATHRRLIAEEWIQMDGAFRVRTSGHLNSDHEYLLYSESREFFNLSAKSQCDIYPPTSSDLMADWMANTLMAMSRSGAPLGPLALYLLAEQPETVKEYTESSQLTLRDILIESPAVESWYQFDHWLVTHQIDGKFTYRLTFSREVDMSLDWVELRRVKAWFPENGMQEQAQTISMDIINYRQMSKRESIDLEEFLIPKGYGCRRNSLAKGQLAKLSRDVIDFKFLSPVEFNYEASLETVNAEGKFETRPVVLTGWFGQCPNSWKQVQLGTNVRVTNAHQHSFDGTSLSIQRVISAASSEGSRSQLRLLNKETGFCTIEYDPTIEANDLVVLDFGKSTVNGTIILRDNLLGILGRDLPEYQLIQYIGKSSKNNWISTVVYELRRSVFKLNEQISGPTSTIRTFERTPRQKSQDGFYYHSNVKIEVNVLGKARLTLRLKDIRSRECVDILDKISTENCYQSSLSASEAIQPPVDGQSNQSRLRSFKLTFSVAGNQSLTLEEFRTNEIDLRRIFIEKLFSLPVDLKPAQIGNVHLTYSKTRANIQTIFNLAEPPSPIEYFVRYSKKTTWMTRVVTHIMRLNSRYACSNWCESLNCLAFSYCYDRTCQILTLDSFRRTGSSLNNLPRFLRENIMTADSCTYYFTPDGKLRGRLNKVVDFLTNQTNQQYQDKLNGSLTIRVQLVGSSTKRLDLVPGEFAEITDETIDINKHYTIMTAHNSTYTNVRFAQELNPAKVQRLQFGTQVKASVVQVTNKAGCLSACTWQSHCQLMSYCDQARICVLVGNITDWPTFKSVLDSAEPNTDCNIASEDYVLDYHQFTNTLKPRNQAMRTTRNLSLVECAAMCEMNLGSTGDCLSFDFCIDYQQESSSDPASTCYLQSKHVIMDTFDETILNQQQQQINDESLSSSSNSSNNICSHYSKSLLADFEIISGKRFIEKRSVMFNSIVAERCALICRKDDTCLSFEHCYSTDEQIYSSCYIHRRNETNEEGNTNNESIWDQLKDAKGCNVYIARHAAEEMSVIHGEKLSIGGVAEVPNYDRPNIDHQYSRLIFDIFALIGSVFVAMVVGIVIHLVFIGLTNTFAPLRAVVRVYEKL